MELPHSIGRSSEVKEVHRQMCLALNSFFGADSKMSVASPLATLGSVAADAQRRYVAILPHADRRDLVGWPSGRFVPAQT